MATPFTNRNDSSSYLFFCSIDQVFVLHSVYFLIAFFSCHDAFPNHIGHLPYIRVKSVSLYMDLIRESVQQAVGRVAIGVFWGGPANFLYFLCDRFLIVELPCHGMDIMGKALWCSVMFFMEKIRSDLITGD